MLVLTADTSLACDADRVVPPSSHGLPGGEGRRRSPAPSVCPPNASPCNRRLVGGRAAHRRGAAIRAGRWRAERYHLWVVLLALSSLSVACSTPEEPEPHRGPVVLITVDTLRADVVGALAQADTPADRRGLTPHLDRFAAEADWAERAVATSSWTVPSMASLMTGLQPWSHGSWHGERAVLAEERLTVAEVMQEAGFHTIGFRSNTWLRPRFGYAQGFDEMYDLGGSKRAIAVLESLGAQGPGGETEAAAPTFVWIHVLPPHAPYLRHDQYAERLSSSPDLTALPQRVTAADLEPYLDPGRPLDEATREVFWTLYRLHVAHSDEIVGALLDALRRSGSWDDSWIVVTSDHGEEFGEAGQIAHGGNLHRVLLEVPLLVKAPRGAGARMEPRPGVSNARIFATLSEAVGVSTGEGVAEPLTVDVAAGALSELYLGNGDNRFSLVEEGPDGSLRQIHWRSRFAPEEPEYFAARVASLADAALPSGESPQQLFDRQAAAFLVAPPLAGNVDVPVVEVRSWVGSSASVPLAEAPLAEASRRLRRAWTAANGDDVAPAEGLEGGAAQEGIELLPEERERLRALGYVVGGR